MQNRTIEWHFPLSFRTMRKLQIYIWVQFRNIPEIFQKCWLLNNLVYIWYGLLQKLEKDKIWPFCLHLNSQVPLNCEDTSRCICWMLQKYSRMLITQESGCASGTDCFRNLNSSLKNQKPELFIWNLMVKYWSDRVQFWIYTAFKAFRTSHQLLSTVVVYRLNKGMRV